MNQPLYCPLCNSTMFGPIRIQVWVRETPREYYLGVVVCCVTCTAVTEVNQETGDLHEFPRVRVADLLEMYNFEELPRSLHTLQRSMLFNRES